MEQTWSKVLSELTSQVTNTALNTLFSRINLRKINNGVAVINCADSFVRELMESRYSQLIKTTFAKVCNENVTVTFVVDDTLIFKKKNIEDNAPLFKATTPEMTVIKKLTNSNINPRFTFENFIVGPSNRLAHAASEAVSERLGVLYNPLFIYGGVGLGKTHLMQSIGNRALQIDSNKNILYCSSETFLNEMVDSIRNAKTSQFRDKYRKLDLLIIDDIQFISKWQETQNELFHTFNELYLANKQIVFASDRPPSEITNLVDRLRSRFEGGMVTDIGEPTFEMKVAILKKKCEQSAFHLPEETLETIAQSVDSNIRELEGALNKIYNHKNVTGMIPNTKEIQDILFKDKEKRNKSLNPNFVLKEVAEEFNVKISDLKSESRKAQYSIPRQVAMYIIREDLHYKLEDTAEIVKRKDHTTVINAINKIEELIKTETALKNKIDLIRSRIRRQI